MKLDGLTPEDREQIERFERFLRIVGKPPVKRSDVSDETWRYMMGEDVEPQPLPGGVLKEKP